MKSVLGNPAILVAYVSTGDIPAVGQVLSYNGVQLYPAGVQNPVLSEQGQYSFWNPEQMYYKASITIGAQVTLATNIATKIRNGDVAASGAIQTNAPNLMAALTRSGEGAPIIHN